jgi:FKBP-type peptidyl-prolyl cis-trans isomerase FkpA
MKNKKRLYYLISFGGLLIVALVFLLKTYRHGFFKKTATGLQYQVVSKGQGPGPQEGDMLLLNVCCKTDKGVVLLNTEDQELPMTLPYSEETSKKDGGFFEAVGMLLQKGDGLMCKLNAGEIFGGNLDHMTDHYGLKKNEEVFLHLQLQDVMTEEMHKKWETEQLAMLQKKQQEQMEKQHKEDAKVIIDYLRENDIVAQATSSGLHYVIDTPGQGVQPKQGNKVKVNYTGRLLDGKVFDTSLADIAEQHGIHNPERAYEALEFQLGVGQVIQGWDEGIMCLLQGAKARLFVPSTLAYGSQSVGNGLIPANSILIFDVELMDVKS